MNEYLILGIEPKLAKEWYEEFNDIAEFFLNEKTNLYSMKVSLTRPQAIKIRTGITGMNIGHKNKMMLIKL